MADDSFDMMGMPDAAYLPNCYLPLDFLGQNQQNQQNHQNHQNLPVGTNTGETDSNLFHPIHYVENAEASMYDPSSNFSTTSGTFTAHPGIDFYGFNQAENQLGIQIPNFGDYTESIPTETGAEFLDWTNFEDSSHPQIQDYPHDPETMATQTADEFEMYTSESVESIEHDVAEVEEEVAQVEEDVTEVFTGLKTIDSTACIRVGHINSMVAETLRDIADSYDQWVQYGSYENYVADEILSLAVVAPVLNALANGDVDYVFRNPRGIENRRRAEMMALSPEDREANGWLPVNRNAPLDSSALDADPGRGSSSRPRRKSQGQQHEIDYEEMKLVMADGSDFDNLNVVGNSSSDDFQPQEDNEQVSKAPKKPKGAPRGGRLGRPKGSVSRGKSCVSKAKDTARGGSAARGIGRGTGRATGRGTSGPSSRGGSLGRGRPRGRGGAKDRAGLVAALATAEGGFASSSGDPVVQAPWDAWSALILQLVCPKSVMLWEHRVPLLTLPGLRTVHGDKKQLELSFWVWRTIWQDFAWTVLEKKLW
jgi:hypothetical protein